MNCLLSRDDFRNATFARDRHRCVACGAPAVDAHHIIERRLFKAPHEAGGYFLDNGASLCEKCHRAAEQTTLSAAELRTRCFIARAVLPEHFYPDREYDKWGNPILPEGRLKGELHDRLSAKSIAPEVIFLDRFVPPRPYHFSHSRHRAGDLILPDETCFEGKAVVVTALPDSSWQAFELYSDGFCGETPWQTAPPGLAALLEEKAALLDPGMRLSGYSDGRETRCHAIWQGNVCLDYPTTEVLAGALEMALLPVVWQGNCPAGTIFSHKRFKGSFEVRLAEAFHVFDIAGAAGRMLF